MSFAAMSTWQALALISVASALAAGLFLMKVRPPREIGRASCRERVGIRV